MKKAISLTMATAIAASLLVGCGGSSSSAAASTADSSSTAESASTAESDASFTDYSAGFPEQVTIDIPVYERGLENWNVTDNYYTRWIQSEFGDKYNVKVNFVPISRSGEVQDFNQMIAAGNAPSIIFHFDMPQAVTYWSSGAMQEIDYDEVAYYAPDYYAKLKDTIDTYGKIDGQNAFIFAEYADPVYYNWVTLIRKDWLDQVGMDVPTSNEEYIQVLEAWKEAGLGTGGETLLTKSFTYFYPWIEADTTEDELALYLDLNVAPLTWSASYNYLKDLNYKWNNGLIDQNFYLVTDDAAAKSKFVSGEVGTYGFYPSNTTDVFSSLLANDPDAEVAVLSSSATGIPAKGYESHYYQFPNYGIIMGINADCTDEERAAVYMYLNWMIQPENLTYLQYGIEGETYTVNDEGLKVLDSSYDGEAKLSPNQNKDYWNLVAAIATYGDEETDLKANKTTLAPDGYDWVIQDSYDQWNENRDEGILTPIFTKAVESSAEYSSDLNTLWQKAYVDLATCDPDEFDTKYEDWCQQYLDAGYQEILDEKQSLWDAGDVLVAE